MGKTRSIRNKHKNLERSLPPEHLTLFPLLFPSQGIFFWNCPSLGWMDGWKFYSKWPCLGVSLSYSPLHLILFLFLSPNDMSWETKHTQVNQIKTHTRKEISSRLSSRTLIPPILEHILHTHSVCVLHVGMLTVTVVSFSMTIDSDPS
jgi:hypothetical protein